MLSLKSVIISVSSNFTGVVSALAALDLKGKNAASIITATAVNVIILFNPAPNIRASFLFFYWWQTFVSLKSLPNLSFIKEEKKLICFSRFSDIRP